MEDAVRRAAAALAAEFDQNGDIDPVFPTSIDAGRRVLHALDNPDVAFEELTRIVISEPLLSAKLIRLANSVALGAPGARVSDVKHAVMRVGIDGVRPLAMALIVDQLRQAPPAGACRQLADALWERSMHVAALAYVLARKMTRLNADEAMFAGVIHDLARFYLLARAGDYPELVADPATLAAVINDLREPVGERLLDQLGLSESLRDAVLAARSYGGSMPPETLPDLLFVAGALSLRPDPIDALDTRVLALANSAVTLGLDQRTVQEMIAASGDEIYSIVLALET
ncbi:HDOD domain-containing protein [Rhodocyclus tenuis]|nr:HDOD domain-containing protein [Rhodocyclus tenuis]